MIQDSSLSGAAEKARILIRSDHLAHVDRRNQFSVRKSSRRETSLLQSFMSSATRDHVSTYLKEDMDSLLFRRNSMLLSFFAALYLDPEAIRRRFEPHPSGRAGATAPNGSSTGSGGTVMDGSGTTRATPQINGAGTSEIRTLSDLDHAPDVVGSGNQIDALEDILNGETEDARHDSDEMDLF